MIEKVEGK